MLVEKSIPSNIGGLSHRPQEYRVREEFSETELNIVKVEEYKMTAYGRPVTVWCSSNRLAKENPLPGSSIILADFDCLVPTEEPDKNLTEKPVSIHETGWNGNPLAGFLIDGRALTYVLRSRGVVAGDMIGKLGKDIFPAVIDGANRLNVLSLIKEYLLGIQAIDPEEKVIVPVEVVDYWNGTIGMGRFEKADSASAKREVIAAAWSRLSNEGQIAVPPKGSRHLKITQAKEALPIRCCQPTITMSLEDIFGVELNNEVRRAMADYVNHSLS